MKSDLENTPRRSWGIIFLLTVALTAGLFLLFKMKDEAPEAVAPSDVLSSLTVGLTRLDRDSGDILLNEEATLLDPTPLFLPTEWNVGRNAIPGNLVRDASVAFENYPPKLTFNETSLVLSFPTPVDFHANAIDVLVSLKSRQPFMGMGRVESGAINLGSRGAKVEINSVADGRLALELVIPDGQIAHKLWQPMEFFLAVDAAGLIGPPAILARSDDERLDVFFQELLANTLQLGRRLTPGVYRVCVGP